MRRLFANEHHGSLRFRHAAFTLQANGKGIDGSNACLGFEEYLRCTTLLNIEYAGVDGLPILRINDPELVIAITSCRGNIKDIQYASCFSASQTTTAVAFGALSSCDTRLAIGT